MKIDIDDGQEQEMEQVQKQGESSVDTSKSSVDTSNTPTPQKRRSESEDSGGRLRKSTRTIHIPSRYKDYALMTQVMNGKIINSIFCNSGTL